MSDDEKQYRRMRDLNNAASKRCRVGRKRKAEVNTFFDKYQTNIIVSEKAFKTYL